MTSYETAWDDTVTGRVRTAGDESQRPLAWLRLTWPATGHEIQRVNIYADGLKPADRQWQAHTLTIQLAVEFIHEHRDDLSERRADGPLPASVEKAEDPWEHAGVVDVI